MMAHVGKEALQRRCNAVVITFKESPRNEPAKRFLSENNFLPLGGRHDVSIRPAEVAQVVFDPDAAQRSVEAHAEGQRRKLEGDASSYSRWNV